MTEGVSNYQIFCILFLGIAGFSLMGLPKVIAEHMGTGGWVSIILTAVIFTGVAYLHAYLAYNNKDKVFFDYSKKLIGSFLTFFFSIIYMLYSFAAFTLMNRLVADIIMKILLPNTPIWAILLPMVLVVYFAVTRGLSNIGRLFEVTFFIVLPTMFFIHLIMFTQGEYVNIQPFFNASKIPDYIKGLQYTIIPFIGFELLTVIPVTKNNNKRLYRYVTLTPLAIASLYIYLLESVFSIVNTNEIVYYKDALAVAIRRIDAPFLQFLRRLDSLFFLIWVLSVFSTLVIISYTTVTYTRKITGSNRGIIPFIIFTASFFIGIMIPEYDQAEKMFDYIFTYFGVIPALIIPLIVLTAMKVKKNDVKKI